MYKCAMASYTELTLLGKLTSNLDKISKDKSEEAVKLRRLRRKLALRKSQLENGLQLFNLDENDEDNKKRPKLSDLIIKYCCVVFLD